MITISGRQTGKTTKQLKNLAELGGVLIVPNHTHKYQAEQLAKKMELNIRPDQIKTLEQFQNCGRTQRFDTLWIDDFETIICKQFGTYPEEITMTPWPTRYSK